jgi:hypothetical protein
LNARRSSGAIARTGDDDRFVADLIMSGDTGWLGDARTDAPATFFER